MPCWSYSGPTGTDLLCNSALPYNGTFRFELFFQLFHNIEIDVLFISVNIVTLAASVDSARIAASMPWIQENPHSFQRLFKPVEFQDQRIPFVVGIATEVLPRPDEL